LADGALKWARISLTAAGISPTSHSRTPRSSCGSTAPFEVQRTGDDTSGQIWERTRRMGINTLAYRLPQHGAFFASDPDCAAHTERTPWEFDRQFLDLVARSGTALFVSVDPRTVTGEQKAAFRAAMQTALSGGTPGGCEPLDWLHTTTPREWRIGGEKATYYWEESAGANPARV